MMQTAPIRRMAGLGTVLMLSVWAFAARAQQVDTVDKANTAWVLTSSALVLLMTLPGLALFYGGLVRARNVLSVIMHCFAICGLVSILWAMGGYSLAFDTGTPLIGTLDKAWLLNLAASTTPAQIPEIAFVLFQMTFAVITPALIIGAFPERVSFGFVILFTIIWVLAVYVPVAHWVWGGGWMATLGAMDFAGGIVVHTTAGISALIAAWMVGPRQGFPRHIQAPHSPGMTMTGAGMLWFGWFGFNGGSALTADGAAAGAIVATHLAASSAAVVWAAIEWVKIGKPTSIGIVTGAVAGLATVTPASGYVGPAAAMLIGAAASAVCFTAVILVKQRMKIDDTLDVFAVHGVGGMLGSLLVAVFASAAFGGIGLAEGRDIAAQLKI